MISNDQQQILDFVRAPLLIIDSKAKPVFFNKNAGNLFMINAIEKIPKAYLKQLKELTAPENLKKIDRLNIKINQESVGERIIQSIHTSINNNYALITLRDITKEVHLIQEYAFNRKELKAKSILYDNKENEFNKLRKHLDDIYNHIPNDIIIIKNNFMIKEASSKIYKGKSSHKYQFCYEYLGKNRKCSKCPLGNEAILGEPQPIGHEVGDDFFLETISPLENSREILLTFKNTTRQVTLIEEIRQQKETIQNQKDLMTDLVDLMALMQKKGDVEIITHRFVKNIKSKTDAKGVALLILGLNQHDFWVETSLGFPKSSIHETVETYKQLPIRDQNINNIPFHILEKDRNPIQKIAINDHAGKKLGYLILEAELSQRKKQIISLFTDPLSSYLTNQLLLKKLEIIAHTDGLTGLFNRYYFKQAFDESQERFNRFGIHYSLLVADANGLKPINDKFGHEAGDAFLIEIADCLKEVSRKTDVVARMGGDEFSVLMPDTNQKGADYLMERIRTYCEGRTFEIPGHEPAPLSMSIGVASTEKYSADEISRVADDAMYADKEIYYQNNPKIR